MVRLERDSRRAWPRDSILYFLEEKENREEEFNHVLSFCLPPSLMKKKEYKRHGASPTHPHRNLGSARRLLVVSLPCVLAEVSSSRPEA